MNRIPLLLAATLLMIACGKKTNFTISGKIDGGAGKSIVLNYLHTTSQSIADSVKMGSDGSFTLKGKVSGPTFFLMKLSDSNFITVLADSLDHITVTGSYNRFAADYEVKGSDNSSKIRDLTFRFVKAKTTLDSLRILYQKNQNDAGRKADLDRWNSEYKMKFDEYTAFVNDFVKKNPFSMATVYALYQKWDANTFVTNDFQAMKTAASALSAVYPRNEQVRALYNNALGIIQMQKNERLNQLITEKAVNSPDIKLPDPSGIVRELWSLHGKYVLLHFWSAKDRTSRVQNQVLAELYATYRNKGFEIYMVSLDDDANAWKAAIAEDHLTCINVGDMKGSAIAVMNYNIQAIPSNYLLDKEGKIIGKNLAGPELTKTLAKLL